MKTLFILSLLSLTVLIHSETLKVDLTKNSRPATHVGSGSLYGLTEKLPEDIASNVASLKSNVFVCLIRSGNDRQQQSVEHF